MEAKGTKLNEEASQRTEDESAFTIKVGRELYSVHQNVLIAASDYFRAMLSHDTKERQVGVVDMKEVEPDALKLCIEFMYTGATLVTMETVENLLPAAGIMLLNALSKKCVEVLEKSLRAENCISVLKLARTHSFTDLEEKALKLFTENYNFDKFEDFAELEKEGLVEHISDFSLRNELAWKVIINWIKLNVEERSRDILELVKLLVWESSPSAELLENLWSEPIFTDSQECKKFLFRHLFMDYEELGQMLTVENCFMIEQLSTEFEFLSKQAMDAIGTFMNANLIPISKKEAFKSLSEITIMSVFEQCSENCIYAESLR
uniref:kelch-like protein 30 n=1 Tax=Styela clava TaxID=7725 RepID=UPI00193A1D4F|nr:kelch-like protein 30 [Styela clava]